MTNLEFLLNCTNIDETTSKIENENQVIRGIFYGSEDLSWTEYEYVFDKDGNYISHKETGYYR